MWKAFVKAWFRFSRAERTGVFLLIIFILLTSRLPVWLFYWQRVPVTDTSDFKALVQAFEAQYATHPDTSAARVEALFYFDPNTLPVAGWQQLGIRERTAQTIQRYLAKGGRFRQPADLQRIYGIPPDLCARLLPYVRIPAMDKKREPLTEAGFQRNRLPLRDSFFHYSHKKTGQPVDVNTADTLAWQSLPGIGPGFARRIVAFREKLGGFYEVGQVAECYGLPDSTFQKIQPFLRIGNGSLKKIDLNLTDEKSLAAHPYIRYKLARLIVAYRNTHAGFRQVEELRGLPLVDEIIYRKIEHYIVIKL
ncbi:ComEA family DNA-binding protein [Chitinophaga nivalis]|uniref:Helix-hairpin-helix domain-containing protein n=1 Tax=Chitinophaga nivalis TaxID=2991709 RepID=A0ABT3IXH9_9BACT|nr:helix-hairpin-helix domain-containing protein [Chitinophaga nivalis]MCW3461870.1 helix-hairpin-helix domain-containing protein [Chitinophaga nivalis]MCW3488439.1 helix-hairpin-helix domain-containing protein [Chitinophaga nivalis]